MLEFWSGISTAATLSSVPEACGLARFRKDAMATTTKTAATAIRTILAGGRFFLAVPNSSPMRIVGPAGPAGWTGAASGALGFAALGFGVLGPFGSDMKSPAWSIPDYSLPVDSTPSTDAS